MVYLYRFSVTMSTPEISPSIHWGSLLHGLLIEHLPDPWPDFLHSGELRPMSQWVEIVDRSHFIWHIHSLDDDLGAALNELLQNTERWECRHLHCTFTREKVIAGQISPAEYVRSFFVEESAPRGLQLSFMTPATHKVQGRYALFPAVDLIGRGLCAHFCALVPDFALADEETLAQVLAHTRISRYELRSSVYCLEGSRVTGYTGRLELHFDGPDPMRRLCGVLFGMADWCGIGIKSSLGMGGCKVSALPERR